MERRLVDTAGIAKARLVVELGPGTGGTTRAMLNSLPEGSKLLAIEIDPEFVSLLRAHPDPRLIAHLDSAENIRNVLALHSLPAPDVVISGIPFSTIPPLVGRQLIREVWSALAPGGAFVAYQFRDRVAVLAQDIAGPPEVTVELLNVPPMRVYVWRKPAREDMIDLPVTETVDKSSQWIDRPAAAGFASPTFANRSPGTQSDR